MKPGDRYIRMVDIIGRLGDEGLSASEIEAEMRRLGMVKSGPRGGRVKPTPEDATAEMLDAAIGAARIFSGQGVAAERAAVVAALRAWAEDGGDPWMTHCADRIAAGEHLTRTGAL
jgi:hypothetical protein